VGATLCDSAMAKCELARRLRPFAGHHVGGGERRCKDDERLCSSGETLSQVGETLYAIARALCSSAKARSHRARRLYGLVPARPSLARPPSASDVVHVIESPALRAFASALCPLASTPDGFAAALPSIPEAPPQVDVALSQRAQAPCRNAVTISSSVGRQATLDRLRSA